MYSVFYHFEVHVFMAKNNVFWVVRWSFKLAQWCNLKKMNLDFHRIVTALEYKEVFFAKFPNMKFFIQKKFVLLNNGRVQRMIKSRGIVNLLN